MSRGNKKAIVCITLGIAIAAIPFFLRTQEKERNNRYIDNFRQEEEQDEAKSKKNDKKKTALSENVIGIVEIPSLNIEYPIFEGAGSEQLSEGIGHLGASAPLCSKGNCVLAGHNGSSRGVYFTNLDQIEKGATVKVTNKDKVTHEYTVKEMKVVNPYDRWVTEPRDTEVLTLFTCANHGTNRFTVKCDPVKDYFEGGGAYGEDEAQ